MLLKLPYYIHHLLIALAIDGVSILIFKVPTGMGFMFYLGREIRDLEKLHGWDLSGMDWKGILWPLVGSVWVYVVYCLIFN